MLEVRARTTAGNSAGESSDLAVDFNATWAVPDADKLMFVSQVSLNSADEIVAGAGAEIPVALSAAGLVGVEQVAVSLTVSPAEAFDLAATTFAGSAAFSLSAPAVEVSEGQVQGGAVVIEAAVDGDTDLGTFTLVTSDNFTEETEAEIVINSVSLGPSSDMRDALDAELLDLSVLPQPAGSGASRHCAASWQRVDFWGPTRARSMIVVPARSSIRSISPISGAIRARGSSSCGTSTTGARKSVSVLGIGTIPSGGSAFLRNTTDCRRQFVD